MFDSKLLWSGRISTKLEVAERLEEITPFSTSKLQRTMKIGYGRAAHIVDLFEMLGGCNRDEWYEKFPKKLPTLLMSGSADPVGDFGKGVSYVYNKLRASGACAELKMYDGARHELFNETCREEVFADLIAWLDNIRKVNH